MILSFPPTVTKLFIPCCMPRHDEHSNWILTYDHGLFTSDDFLAPKEWQGLLAQPTLKPKALVYES